MNDDEKARCEMRRALLELFLYGVALTACLILPLALAVLRKA